MKRKNILFDGTAIQPSELAAFHGGSEYARTILSEALRRKCTFDIVFLEKRNVPEDILGQINEAQAMVECIYVRDKQGLYSLLQSRAYDLFYSPLPYDYFDYNGTVPVFGVLHGVRDMECPWDKYSFVYAASLGKKMKHWVISQLPFTWHLRRKKYESRIKRLMDNPMFRFTTISEHSKYALLNFFPRLNPEDISVFYSPIEIEISENASGNPDSDYYLLVSGNRPVKNTYRAIMAFDKLFNEGRLRNKRVIVTGVPNPRIFSRFQKQANFEFLPYVAKTELDSLFQHAYCFVYPSLSEGFGYPPLQTMAKGVPVIASSSTSIPEVCGNAALYFSPTNIDDMCNRILQLEYNRQTYDSLVKAGYARIRELKRIIAKDLEKQLGMIFGRV